MKTNVLVAILLVVLAAGGIWFVRNRNQPVMEPSSGGTAGTSQDTSSMMPASGATGVTEMTAEGDVQEVTVEGSEFKFSPATLTFKKGQTVRLTLKNVGKMPHDWVVDELGVRTKTIPSGDTDTIEFTPEKAGTFEYYCSVGQHRANGMVGTLTVTE